MKKALLFVLACILLAALTACAIPEEQPSPQSVAPTSTDPAASTSEESAGQKVDTTVLDNFVEDNKVYFDLHISSDSIKDFSLTVGSETLKESKQIAFNMNDTIQQNGEPVEGKKFNIYIVRKYETNGSLSIEHFINIGVRADKLGDLLARSYAKLSASTKVYIAVLETVDGWNHDLSPKLNELLNQIKPAE